MHDAEPAAEDSPGAQGLHVAFVVAVVAVEKKPVGHLMQLALLPT